MLRCIVLFLFLVLLPAKFALAVEDLPWLDDFDAGPRPTGSLVDDLMDWTVEGTGSAMIEPGIGSSGSQGLLLDTGSSDHLTVSQQLNDAYEPLVWTDFHAKLSPYAPGEGPPDVPTDATVAFYLTSDGELKALDGDTWRIVKTGLDTSLIYRYTFCQDFRADPGVWRLWIDGELLSPSPLAFTNPRRTPLYLRFVQAGERIAAIDDVRVQRGAPPGLEDVGYYSGWSAGFTWPDDDDNPQHDANFNRLSNFLEYALDFEDPTIAGVLYLPEVVYSADGSTLTFTYRRNLEADDVSYCVERSHTLNGWTVVNSRPEDIEFLDLDDDLIDESVRVTITNPDPSLPIFVRLHTQKQ